MKPTREIERETDATVYDGGEHRPIVLIIGPGKTLGLRLKGSGRRLEIPVSTIYALASSRDRETPRRGK